MNQEGHEMVVNLYLKCIYEASISLMCSNVEQIITLISNLMDELYQSARVNSKRHSWPISKAGFPQWYCDEKA